MRDSTTTLSRPLVCLLAVLVVTAPGMVVNAGSAAAAVNRAPECHTMNRETLRTGKPLTFEVSCWDPDGDALSLEVAQLPMHGDITTDSGAREITYVPDAGYLGTDYFTFRAFDGLTRSFPASLRMTVTPNHAPACSVGQPAHTSVSTPQDLRLNCYDDDPQDRWDLTYAVVSGPSHGTLSPLEFDASGAAVTYTPSTGYSGEDSFVFSASDGELVVPDVQQIRILDTPYCSVPPDAAVRSGRNADLPIDCTAPMSQGAPQIELADPPTQGQVARLNGSWWYSASADASGQDSFTYRARTPSGGVSQTVMQQIETGADANNPPRCGVGSARVVWAGRPSKLIPCSDPDGDAIQYEAVSQPDHGTVRTTSGGLTYVASDGYIGADSFNFIAYDARGLSASATESVEVRVPEVPLCDENREETVRAGYSSDIIMVVLMCDNPQIDEQSYRVVTPPTQGTLEVSQGPGDFTYTASLDGSGLDRFVLMATNEVGDSEAISFTVYIIPLPPFPNRAPACVPNTDDPQVIESGATAVLAIDAQCDDPDGDALTLSDGAPLAEHSEPTLSGNQITYTADGGYSGVDSIGYSVDDGRGGAATGVYTVEITPARPSAVSIGLNRPSTTWPQTVTVSGRVTRSGGAAMSAEPVELWAEQAAGGYAKLRDLVSSDDGNLSSTHRPSAGTTYQWRVPGSSVQSWALTAVVGPRLTAGRARPTAAVRGEARISGIISPARVGTPIRLQRWSGSGWSTIASTTTTVASTSTTTGAPYAFAVKAAESGTFSYRVLVPADAGRIAAQSPTIKVGFYAASLVGHRATGNEWVAVKNVGRVALDLKWWMLRNRVGRTRTIPSRVLRAGRTIRVHSGEGPDTMRDLYLGKAALLGDRHDRITLRNRAGVVVARRHY